MDHEELQALVTKCQAGDPEAQENLIRAVENRVYFQCLKVLNDKEDALDTTQEVLISMLRSLSTLRNPASFWKWLNRITYRSCCRCLGEKVKNSKIVTLEENIPDDLEEQISPEQEIDKEENRRIINELVEELPESQRMCVLMYYYDEMSLNDIADTLGTSVGTVKSRLYYARQHIKGGVERYTRQGFVLYGVSPLPFLRYYLHQEAAQTLLGAAAAASISEATPAAAAVTGTAAGGAAAMSAGAKAAVALVGLLLAGTLAGGVLMQQQKPPEPEPIQTIQQEPAAEDPGPPFIPPATATDPEKLPEPPQPEPPVQEPPGAEPDASPVPLSTAPRPAARPEPEVPTEILPEDLPDVLPEIPLEAPVSPEPAEPPDPQPVAWVFPTTLPVPELPQSSFVPPASQPLQPVAPPLRTPWEPDDSAPGIPVPDNPTPDNSTPYDPTPAGPTPTVISRELTDFGFNSGRGYVSSFAAEWGEELPEGLVYECSDEWVVSTNEEGDFYTYHPGTAVLTATDPNDPNHRYELTVTVQDNFNWSFERENIELDLGQSEKRDLSYQISDYCDIWAVIWSSSDENLLSIWDPWSTAGSMKIPLTGKYPGTVEVTGRVFFNVEFPWGMYVMEDTITFPVTVKPVPPEEHSIEFTIDGRVFPAWNFFSCSFDYITSSNPDVVQAEDELFICTGPGSADIIAYRYNPSMQPEVAGILHITPVKLPEGETPPESVDPAPVHPEPVDPAPSEPAAFRKELGWNPGYGFLYHFSLDWDDLLPERLSYTSSNPAVVQIDEDGYYCTLSAGTAELTAAAPDGSQYILTIHVQNASQLKYTVPSATVSPGEEVSCLLSEITTPEGFRSASVVWTSSDPDIVKAGQNNISIGSAVHLIGVSPGTAELTGNITFWLDTPMGIIELHDSAQIPVEVVPEAIPEAPEAVPDEALEEVP